MTPPPTVAEDEELIEEIAAAIGEFGGESEYKVARRVLKNLRDAGYTVSKSRPPPEKR